MNEKVEYLFDDEVKPKKGKNTIIALAFLLALISCGISLYFWNQDKKSDSMEPTITLLGDSAIVLEIGENYTELGYVANDYEDGELTNKVKISGEIDSNKPGIYTISYTVKDSSKQEVSALRHIVVESDNSTLNLKLNGDNFILLKKGSDFIDEGYLVKDNKGNDVSSDVFKFGEVDLDEPGVYTLVYAIKNNNEVSALKRKVLIYESGNVTNDEQLVKTLKNSLINEMHQNIKMESNNISESGLLAMAFKVCTHNGSMTHEQLTTCLKETFGINKDISKNANYSESLDNIGIHYDGTSRLWYDSKDEYGLDGDIKLLKALQDGNNMYLYMSYAYNPFIYGNDFSCEDGEAVASIYADYSKKEVSGKLICKAIKVDKTCETDCEYRYDTIKEYMPTIYKHTFKRYSNSETYYWVSTEPVK